MTSEIFKTVPGRFSSQLEKRRGGRLKILRVLFHSGITFPKYREVCAEKLWVYLLGQGVIPPI